MKMRSIGHMTDRALALAAGLIYDDRCPTCGKRADSFATAPLCSACWDEIAAYTGPACRVCAKPYASPYSTVCAECMKEPPAFGRAAAFGLYEGIMREAIHTLKFNRVKRLARPLGRMLAALDLPEADCVVPVPCGVLSLRERGFNQSLEIARVLADARGVPLVSGVLFKRKETRPQVGLTRSQRIDNLRGAFDTRESLDGRRVILVDDVITTGATAQACSRVLRRAGAAHISLAALARTY